MWDSSSVAAVAGVVVVPATDLLAMRIVVASGSDPLFQLHNQEALLLLGLPFGGLARLL